MYSIWDRSTALVPIPAGESATLGTGGGSSPRVSHVTATEEPIPASNEHKSALTAGKGRKILIGNLVWKLVTVHSHSVETLGQMAPTTNRVNLPCGTVICDNSVTEDPSLMHFQCIHAGEDARDHRVGHNSNKKGHNQNNSGLDQGGHDLDPGGEFPVIAFRSTLQ